MRKKGKYFHPLTRLFGIRDFGIYTEQDGLNGLQNHGLISDQVQSFNEIPAVDIQRVMEFAAGILERIWPGYVATAWRSPRWNGCQQLAEEEGE